jgi:chaperonin GroEL
VCERSAKNAGDGTTTAIVLAGALVKAGQTAGASPQAFSREIKKAYVEKVKPVLESLAKPIRGLPEKEAFEAVRKVALVSANHDHGIAQVVAEAARAVGEDGVIEVEEGAGSDVRWVAREGYAVSGGLQSLGGSAGPSFVNRQATNDCALDNVFVILYDGELSKFNDLLPFLELIVSAENKPSALIFAHQFGDEVLKTLAQNFRRGSVNAIPMKTPRGGHGQSEVLRDLAAYVGGKVFDSQGLQLKDATLETAGFVQSVRIDQNETRLIGKPLVKTLDARITELKARLADSKTEFDQGLLRFRIGRMTSGVATVYAGGATALEAMERRDRAVDAVSAVRCALDGGVVPGGGCALLHASAALENHGAEFSLKQALSAPFYRILKNAEVAKEPIVAWDDEQRFLVYDALDCKLVEWWESGIMDPLKVVTGAVENAISVAHILLTLRGAVSEILGVEENQMKALQSGLQKVMESA